MPDDDCIFCKIVAGELPAEIVQEDEHTLAFMDINPWTRGHALVIPRNHSRNLYEAPEEDLARTIAAAKRLALRMRDALGCDGVNLLNSLRAGRVADGLPLARARDPALRRRSAAAARPAAQPEEATSWPRSRRSSAVAERARLERDGDLGVLVIDNQPLNLFGGEMVRRHPRRRSTRPRLPGAAACARRATYFTGGVDVNVFKGLSESDATQLTADLLAITHRIEELPFPTLASVQGLCLTAGLELSLACDMIWAAESAQFGLVEAVIGLTPLMGGTQRIAERAGSRRGRASS